MKYNLFINLNATSTKYPKTFSDTFENKEKMKIIRKMWKYWKQKK